MKINISRLHDYRRGLEWEDYSRQKIVYGGT